MNQDAIIWMNHSEEHIKLYKMKICQHKSVMKFLRNSKLLQIYLNLIDIFKSHIQTVCISLLSCSHVREKENHSFHYNK